MLVAECANSFEEEPYAYLLRLGAVWQEDQS